MSPLQTATRRRLAREPYTTAGQETHNRRPVNVVWIFSYQTFLATEGAEGYLRTPPRYRTQPVLRERRQLAETLRELRRKGLDRHDARRLALMLIDAPAEYYERREREQIAHRMRQEILRRLANV
jgi:hypothetical protein